MQCQKKSRIYSTCVSSLNKIKISGEETDFVLFLKVVFAERSGVGWGFWQCSSGCTY